jgi:hypothetical protein
VGIQPRSSRRGADRRALEVNATAAAQVAYCVNSVSWCLAFIPTTSQDRLVVCAWARDDDPEGAEILLGVQPKPRPKKGAAKKKGQSCGLRLLAVSQETRRADAGRRCVLCCIAVISRRVRHPVAGKPLERVSPSARCGARISRRRRITSDIRGRLRGRNSRVASDEPCEQTGGQTPSLAGQPRCNVPH